MKMKRYLWMKFIDNITVYTQSTISFFLFSYIGKSLFWSQDISTVV